MKPRPASLYPLVNGVHGDFSVATLEDCKNPLAQVVPTVDNLATNIFEILVKHNGVNREAQAREEGRGTQQQHHPRLSPVHSHC